jgi:hypothetical protein
MSVNRADGQYGYYVDDGYELPSDQTERAIALYCRGLAA